MNYKYKYDILEDINNWMKFYNWMDSFDFDFI